MTFIQPNSSVMSIGAITSPCSNPDTLKSRQPSIDSMYSSDFHLPSLTQVSGFNQEYRHNRFNSEGTTVHSGGSSDLESVSNYSCSPPPQKQPPSSYKSSPNGWLNSVYTISDRKNMYSKEPLLHAFDMNEYNRSMEYSSGYLYSDKPTKVRKGDALATRRARNKLASAKYRAKKQALTHAMQERIMQLATQVMSLRDELNQSKKNETEVMARYERLATYFQHTNGKLPSPPS